MRVYIKVASCVLCFTFLSIKTFAQISTRGELKMGIGIAIDEGDRETGVGGIVILGYQKSFLKNRLRIGPMVRVGNFIPLGITDTRDQYFRSSTLDLSSDFDIIKYKAVSLFAGAGGFINYSRGLLGTGGWPSERNNGSDYFFKLYAGGKLKGGLRINPEKRKFTIEFVPFNVFFGNDYFLLGSINFLVGIKLPEK